MNRKKKKIVLKLRQVYSLLNLYFQALHIKKIMWNSFLSCCFPHQIQLIYFLNKPSFSFQMGGSANNSGSSLLSRQNSQKTPPRVENNLVRALSQPSPTINTKEAMQVFFLTRFTIGFIISSSYFCQVKSVQLKTIQI